jgi:hypothetical protein
LPWAVSGRLPITSVADHFSTDPPPRGLTEHGMRCLIWRRAAEPALCVILQARGAAERLGRTRRPASGGRLLVIIAEGRCKHELRCDAHYSAQLHATGERSHANDGYGLAARPRAGAARSFATLW